jgi:hypothetical protein
MDPISLFWVPQGTFLHVGFVVASIQDSVQSFAASVDATWDGEIIHDPNQLVQVTFLHGKHSADPPVELAEPAAEKSPVLGFLQRGASSPDRRCLQLPSEAVALTLRTSY